MYLVLYPGMEKQGRTLAYSCSSFLNVKFKDLCPLPMGVAIGPFRPTLCFCSSETKRSSVRCEGASHSREMSLKPPS